MMSNPIVTITMENGDVMKAELYPEIAPNTVNNFISLVKKGFYDGLIFHRVGRRDWRSRAEILQAQSAGTRITASRVSSPRTDLRTTSHTPQAFSPWHVPCSRTQRRKPVLHHAQSCSASDGAYAAPKKQQKYGSRR